MSDVVEVSPPASSRGRRRWIGVAVVVGVLAAGGGVGAWAATRDGGSAVAGGATSELTCPGSAPNPVAPDWSPSTLIPSLPTAPGAEGRLVPPGAPTDVLVCGYETPAPDVVVGPVNPGGIGTSPAGPDGPSDPVDPPAPVDTPLRPTLDLSRSARADGSDPAVARLLSALQGATIVGPGDHRSCPEIAWSNVYLIGLTYDDGVVWVASPDSCSGTTNGAVAAIADVTGPARAALTSLSTKPLPPTPVEVSPSTVEVSPSTVEVSPSTVEVSPGPGTVTASGDPGSGGSTAVPVDPIAACAADGAATATREQLVPFTPSSVTVCLEPVDGTPTTVSTRPRTVAVPLADALNALPPLVTEACTAQAGPRWGLLFHGAGDAQVVVSVDAGGCGTAAAGDRVSHLDADVLALLTALG
ncbi:hypothetical protein ACXR2U_22710 [Jatrophihabitans sp. YIM 134969]